MNSPLLSPYPPLQLICDLEVLLLDRSVAVNHALDRLAQELQLPRSSPPLSEADLQQCSPRQVIGELIGADDDWQVDTLLAQYQHHYEQQSRWQAPLRLGARALLRVFEALGARLHYLSTDSPQNALRLVAQHGLQDALTTVYTPPHQLCACHRAQLLENFLRRHPQPPETLLLSDNLAELQLARRRGMPALALGFAQTPAQRFELESGLDIASSLNEVKHFLLAHHTVLRLPHLAARRSATLWH